MLVNSLTGNILLNYFLISINDVSINIGTVFELYAFTHKYVYILNSIQNTVYLSLFETLLAGRVRRPNGSKSTDSQ